MNILSQQIDSISAETVFLRTHGRLVAMKNSNASWSIGSAKVAFEQNYQTPRLLAKAEKFGTIVLSIMLRLSLGWSCLSCCTIQADGRSRKSCLWWDICNIYFNKTPSTQAEIIQSVSSSSPSATAQFGMWLLNKCRWELRAKPKGAADSYKGFESEVTGLHQITENKLLATSANGSVAVWDLRRSSTTLISADLPDGG